MIQRCVFTILAFDRSYLDFLNRQKMVNMFLWYWQVVITIISSMIKSNQKQKLTKPGLSHTHNFVVKWEKKSVTTPVQQQNI